MMRHLPALIIVVPLLAALIAAGSGWINSKAPFRITVAALFFSFFCAVLILIQVVTTGIPMEYRMAGWAAPIGIVYVIDHLSAIVLVVITAVSTLNLVAQQKSIATTFNDKEGAFNALYLLFTAGLIGMTATGDAFNLYVLLEIVSLSGYALIGLGNSRAPLATLNYLFLGTIGATFYLLGVGYLYIETGTLNMAELAITIPKLMNSGITLFAFIICLTGLFTKMALFPVHGWLPEAYSQSTSVSAGLIAPLTTKVTVYILIRICLSVFTPEYTFGHLDISGFMVLLAVITIIFGSLSALAQKNVKKMFSYIIIAEVGYMVGGFFLGNRLGISGAMLHIINDAAMTLTLFLAAGIFSWKTNGENRNDLKGLFAKMPFTMAGFVLAGLCVVGVPPTCGFFSKWYLISGGLQAGNYLYVAALLFSSLVNAVLFFRLFEIAYFEPFTEGHGDGNSHGSHAHTGTGILALKEAPLEMLIPFLIASLTLIALGLYSGTIVTNIIQFAIPTGVI